MLHIVAVTGGTCCILSLARMTKFITTALKISQFIAILMRLGQGFGCVSLMQVSMMMIRLGVVLFAVFSIFCC
jgi:hypothetical protein